MSRSNQQQQVGNKRCFPIISAEGNQCLQEIKALYGLRADSEAIQFALFALRHSAETRTREASQVIAQAIRAALTPEGKMYLANYLDNLTRPMEGPPK